MPARPDDHRRHKLILPIALLVIFAACISLAAGVNELKRARLIDGLAEPTRLDRVSIRPPKGWQIDLGRPSMGWPFDSEERELELLAREPGEGRVRTMRIRTIPQWTAGDRLQSLYQLIDVPSAAEFIDESPIPFAGAGRGYLLQAEQAVAGQRVARQYLIALGTADDRTAVYIVLDTPNRLNDDDLQLISRVALSVRTESDR